MDRMIRTKRRPRRTGHLKQAKLSGFMRLSFDLQIQYFVSKSSRPDLRPFLPLVPPDYHSHVLRSSLWLAPEKADYRSAGIRRLLFLAALLIAAYAVMHRTFRISGPPSVRADGSEGGPSKAWNTALMWGCQDQSAPQLADLGNSHVRRVILLPASTLALHRPIIPWEPR